MMMMKRLHHSEDIIPPAHDCVCAIPIKPAKEHAPCCPVYHRWVMLEAPMGQEIHIQTKGRK
jgi:hypothetical protein